ncbi:MAG TPA: hypothetical protein VN449_07350 [Gaiellaceae bacterium]|nr:hypothetical protein [Gaiellaceae bacterium]
MPYHWLKIPSSPPKQRRDDVKDKANGKGGSLVGAQIFYDATGQAYALIKDPGNPGKLAELLADLGVTDQLGLVDADEKDAGAQPPA